MKPIHPVQIALPPPDQRVCRDARFAAKGEKKTRYTLPDSVYSGSPVGYRVRASLTLEESTQALSLLSMERPTGFSEGPPPTDQELFEEASLGILSARQSTNYRGHRQITLGPDDSRIAAEILRGLDHRGAEVLDGATHTHVVLCRPYRTPFTMLLTFIGHKALQSLATVPMRALRKRYFHTDDIPTIGYLTSLHLGILADGLERACVIASQGHWRGQVHQKPFAGKALAKNAAALEPLYAMCNVSAEDRSKGWQIGIVAQIGHARSSEAVPLSNSASRKLGANLLAFRSERIQPGVNAEEKAPASFHKRQDMDVEEELTVMCGRAAYNAFSHWSGCDRERSKDVLLLERIDVLSPEGKRRIRETRTMLSDITDRVVETLPKWADLPLGKALSRNAERARKAFALAGQRIYLVGLSRDEMAAEGIDWDLGIRAVGAACARSALVVEIMGTTELPDGCDLLAGVCLMAGPVNQNDIGKQFFGYSDMLSEAFPNRNPTSLLVWTLKAKTVADPIGNEEQLLNAARKGALVDLRAAPHDVVHVRVAGEVKPFRKRDRLTSTERAFHDVGNFVTDSEGRHIEGNLGAKWPYGDEVIW
jgi:hypothetical protein